MADELTRLGLVNRSVRLVAGTTVWGELARLIKPRSGLIAAIAHVGSGRAGLLPFGRGAAILTNAAIESIRSGTTDPSVLLNWVEAGASVYSMESLHATLILAEGDPAFVVAGSGGSPRSSAEAAVDAMVISDDPDTVKDARVALTDWRRQAGAPLTPHDIRGWLDEFGVDRPRQRSTASVAVGASNSPLQANSPSSSTAASSSSVGLAPGPRVVTLPTSRPSVPQRNVTVLAAKVPPPPSIVFPGASDLPAGPRPTTLTVTGIFRKGDASPEAERRLDSLKEEHETGDNVGIVEMYWWDLAPGSSNVRLYRDGEYVVGVDLGETGGRRQKRCPLWPPGRVLHTYTDGAAWPVRVYCYLLLAGSGHAPTLGDLQESLLGIGEKLEFDRGYMRDAVINAILGLWPDVSYRES